MFPRYAQVLYLAAGGLKYLPYNNLFNDNIFNYSQAIYVSGQSTDN